MMADTTGSVNRCSNLVDRSHMSTDDASEYSDTAEQVQSTVEKDILVTAYADPEAYDEAASTRQFIADAFGEFVDYDPHEQEQKERTDVTVQLDVQAEDPRRGRTREVTPSLDIFSSRSERVIKSAVEEGIIDDSDIDWLDVEVEEYTEDVYVHDNSDPMEDALDAVLGDHELPVEDFESSDTSIWVAKWTRSVDVTGPMTKPDETEKQKVRVTARASDVSRRRLLAPQDEREHGERFDDESKRWSLQVNVAIEASTEAEISEIEQSVAPLVVDRLMESPMIEATRVTDCEKVTTAKGACYDV